MVVSFTIERAQGGITRCIFFVGTRVVLFDMQLRVRLIDRMVVTDKVRLVFQRCKRHPFLETFADTRYDDYLISPRTKYRMRDSTHYTLAHHTT